MAKVQMDSAHMDRRPQARPDAPRHALGVITDIFQERTFYGQGEPTSVALQCDCRAGNIIDNRCPSGGATVGGPGVSATGGSGPHVKRFVLWKNFREGPCWDRRTDPYKTACPR